MSNKSALRKSQVIRKKIGVEERSRNDALQIAHILLTVGIKHCNVSERLDQSSEIIEFHRALKRDIESKWQTTPLYDEDLSFRRKPNKSGVEFLLFSKYQDYNSVGLERLIAKWLKGERYAVALYALLEIVWRHAEMQLRMGDKGGTQFSPTKNQSLTTLSFVGRSYLKVLVQAQAIESALEIYKECPFLCDHGPTAAALLEQSISDRRLKNVRELRKALARAEPNHSLLAQADEAITRLAAYERLTAEKNLDADKISKLAGSEFERLVAKQFNDLGYEAEEIGHSGDYGADVKVVTDDGSLILVQCKRHNKKVNLKAVQEVLGSIGHYGGDFGVVITNNRFLNSAKELAKSNDIELWGSERLALFLIGDISFSEITEL